MYMWSEEDRSKERMAQDLLSIDWLFRPKTIITADAIGGKRKADTYVYMFALPERDVRNGSDKGSAHGAELKYCFDVFHHYSDQVKPYNANDGKKFADGMSDMWAHFAHDGTPGVSSWKPYTKENGELIMLGMGSQPVSLQNHDRRLEEIIDRHCFKQLDEFRKAAR